jgi:hypothetical protein
MWPESCLATSLLSVAKSDNIKRRPLPGAASLLAVAVQPGALDPYAALMPNALKIGRAAQHAQQGEQPDAIGWLIRVGANTNGSGRYARMLRRIEGMAGRRPGQDIYLKKWLNEPYVQEPVITALKSAEWPLTLREVAEQADVHLRGANRVLCRLHKKGLVSRRKLAMQRHAFCRKRWEIVPGAARRLLFVYKWRGEAC